jgi:hypothetical protein
VSQRKRENVDEGKRTGWIQPLKVGNTWDHTGFRHQGSFHDGKDAASGLAVANIRFNLYPNVS